MFRRNFLFGVDSDTANVIGVTASDIYQPGKGFGFVIEQNRREQELLKISELNAGFDTFYWYQDKNISHIQEDENGCFLDSSAEIALLEQEAGETWLSDALSSYASFFQGGRSQRGKLQGNNYHPDHGRNEECPDLYRKKASGISGRHSGEYQISAYHAVKCL